MSTGGRCRAARASALTVSQSAVGVARHAPPREVGHVIDVLNNDELRIPMLLTFLS